MNKPVYEQHDAQNESSGAFFERILDHMKANKTNQVRLWAYGAGKWVEFRVMVVDVQDARPTDLPAGPH